MSFTIKVYLDAFFVVNLVMDYIVLKTTVSVLEHHCRWWRIMCAALLGSVWAVVALVLITRFQRYKALICFVTYTIISVMMLWIVLGRAVRQKILRGLVILFAVTFALAGICFGLWNYMAPGYAWISGMIQKEQVVLGVILLLVVKFILNRIIYVRKKYDSAIYEVRLQVLGKTAVFNGLLDTGNVLVDPYTGKIVHIVSAKVLQGLFEGEADFATLHYRLVPYNSVGQTRGLLPVIDVDSMEIYECNKMILKKTAAVGIYEGELTGNGHYEAILNAAVFKT